VARNHEMGKNFELRCAQFLKGKGFKVKVGTNARIKGMSGASHPMDVLITDEKDNPIKAVECKWKDKNKPVGRGEIDKFITQCEDVDLKPIFITNTNYSRGARQIAFKKNVELYTEKDMQGVKSMLGSIEKWEEILGTMSEFEQFIKSLEALYKSRIFDYKALIDTLYPYGHMNEKEFTRLEIEDPLEAKNLKLIYHIFLITKLDQKLEGGTKTRLSVLWLKDIFETNPKLVNEAGITPSSFENFSQADKVKLFFESLEILYDNSYFKKAEEVFNNAEIVGKTVMKLGIDSIKDYIRDIASDKNKTNLAGLILGIRDLVGCINTPDRYNNLEIGRYSYADNIRNLIYHKDLFERYSRKKTKIEEIIAQLYLNE
jgi:hypothetical protein